MTDNHRLTPKNFRPEPDEWADALARLPDGRRMDSLLRACLRWFRSDPATALAELEEHWPPDRPRGRNAHRTPDKTT